jgi:hypothetical protein
MQLINSENLKHTAEPLVHATEIAVEELKNVINSQSMDVIPAEILQS